MPDEFNAEEFQKDWNLFKKTHQEQLKALASGQSVAELEEKLSKINESLDKQQEIADRMARIETAMKRTSQSLESKGSVLTEEQAEHKELFTKWFRKGGDGAMEQKLHELQSKALSVNDDTSGGFMVHADLSGRIVRRVFETSPIRAYAAVQSISTDALEGPIDTNEADYGWVGETGTRAQTATPKIGMWRIPVHEMYAQPAATQKLLDDAAWDSETWLAGKVADKFARAENNAFVLGNGVTRPRGFLTYTVVAEDTSLDFTAQKKIGYIKTGVNDAFPAVPTSSAPTAQANPLVDLVYSLKGAYRDAQGTAFAMHRTTFAAVRKLQDAHGNYVWQPGLQGQPATLMGYPIAEFNDMPKLGDTSKLAIAFANWREFYQIVDRVGIRVLRDPYTAKPFILFYSTKRTGGDVLNFEACKLLNFIA